MIRGEITRREFTITILSCVVVLIPAGGITYGFNSTTPYMLSFMKANNPDDATTKADFGKVYAALLTGHAIAMILGGILERKISTKWLALISVTAFNCFIVLIHWTCRDIYLLIINYLLLGLSLGVVYISCIIVSLSWVYESYHGIVAGIACFGYGLSAVLISPLQTWYINPNNVAATYNDTYGEYIFSDSSVVSKTPKMFVIYGIASSLLQIPLSLLIVKNQVCGRVKDVKDLRAIISIREFYILFFIFMMIKTPLAFIASYAKFYGETFISDDMFLSIICGFAAVFNSLGRPFWGYVYDRVKVKLCLFLLCVGAGLSIILFYASGFIPVLWLAKLLYTLSLWSTFFCVVGSYAVMPAAAAHYFGGDDIGIKYGILYLGQALGAVVSMIYVTFIPFWYPIVITVTASSLLAGVMTVFIRPEGFSHKYGEKDTLLQADEGSDNIGLSELHD